jgi:CHC2 zinc finger
MSYPNVDGKDNLELRVKIDQAKRRLPMPALMVKIGLGEHAKKEAHCPWHSDEHPSFSVFKKADGAWWHKCFVGCSEGDEIALLMKHLNISRRDTIKRYLDMAGFPSRVPNRSHEYPKSPQSHQSHERPECHESRKSPVFPVYPMSNGQGLQKALKELGTRNTCNERIMVKKGLWQLARDVRGFQKQIDRKLTNSELRQGFDEWYRLSQPFLDPTKRDDYLAAFLAKLAKVRIPRGEGDTLNKALQAVANFSVSELPAIPGIPDAPEKLRRVAALHRELSRLCGGKTYFLTCRDAAKAYPALTHQAAWNINGALAQLGVIEVVRPGDARLGGRASQFRYLASSEHVR